MDRNFLLRVIAKAALLLIVLNGLFAVLQPLPGLAQFSIYNRLVPGRARLPYGDVPEKAYNLTLDQVEALFAAHEIAGRPELSEFRVAVVGDSSVWGFLLPPEQTLAATLEAARPQTPDGRWMRFFNLGYPTLSLTKDLLVLQEALRYEPDLVIWLVTLESFPRDKQLASPLVQNNPQRMAALIRDYGLNLDPGDSAFAALSIWDQTLVGRRRQLAELIRLQLYGVLWAATGIDQYVPEAYDPPQSDLSDDLTFHDLQPPVLQPADLAFDALEAGMALVGDTRVLLVNEPIFISQGQNNDLRYNFFYPRWAYDGYRRLLAGRAREEGWRYLDVWDLVPADEFTNSAVHLSPRGTSLLAEAILEAIDHK